ncbi:MAG: hypothetical protein NVS4B9_38890 [Ktedonobacteraceae bacterium]
MHMSIVESYVRNVAFTEVQVRWIATNAPHMTEFALNGYRRHYSRHKKKEHTA